MTDWLGGGHLVLWWPAVWYLGVAVVERERRGLNNKSECCQYTSYNKLCYTHNHHHHHQQSTCYCGGGGRGWGEHAEKGEKGYNCGMSWKNLIITQIIWPGVGTGLQTDLSTLVLFLSDLAVADLAYFTFSTEGRVTVWQCDRATRFMLSWVFLRMFYTSSLPAPVKPGSTGSSNGLFNASDSW